MSSHTFEEEEFSSRLNGRVILRILKLIRPYAARVALFLGVEAILGSMAYYQDKNTIFYRNLMDATADSLTV